MSSQHRDPRSCGVYISTKLLDILPDTRRNGAMITTIRPVVEKYDNLGVRIEDDYIVTQRGMEWISRALRQSRRSRRS